jgi:hypothetical protein
MNFIYYFYYKDKLIAILILDVFIFAFLGFITFLLKGSKINAFY